MPTATDAYRIAKVHTPLGDKLVFRQISGREEISGLFEYRLEMLAEEDSTIDPKALLGQGIVVEILIQGGGSRYLNCECVRFAYIGTEPAGLRNTTLWRYEAVLRPWLWYLTRTTTCKIFQFETVPDIVTQVLGKYPFTVDPRLSKSYRSWDYCVQYQETDFNFVSRLMEHEGIYYWFEHSMDSCTLVLADDLSVHPTLPGYATIPHIRSDRLAKPDQEYIDYWEMAQEVDSGVYVTDDYYYKTPSANLRVNRYQELPFPYGDSEIYDWPGGYTEPQPWGDQYAQTRIEELQQSKEITTGQSDVRGLAAGYLFTLESCPRRDQNREYLIRAVNTFLRDNAYTTGGAPADWKFVLEAQPTTYPYRPTRLTPKPHISGPQTAVVTGPKDEEIHTDELGRVKVHFRWDRYQEPDENSSCWIRVSSSWAGSNWGQISLPRIGQEVIVDFIDGDPDYPIITGRVYNQEHKPPYELPKYKEYSTIKSHSTKKGGTTNWNELRFYDYKGKEQVFIHANWRMDVRVKWNMYKTVQESYHCQVHKSYYRTVGGTTEIYSKGKLYERAEDEMHVTAGGAVKIVAEKTYQLSSDDSIEVNAKNHIVVESQSEVTLKVGANFIKVDMTGVTIQGMMVKINCGGMALPVAAFDADHPMYAADCDDGTPGYLDRPPTGGGGWKRGSSKGGNHQAPSSPPMPMIFIPGAPMILPGPPGPPIIVPQPPLIIPGPPGQPPTIIPMPPLPIPGPPIPIIVPGPPIIIPPAQPIPGSLGPYGTADDAARAALASANPTSIAENREYVGMIYQDPATGSYYATDPQPAGLSGGTLPVSSIPPGMNEAGMYHTHGNYSKADGTPTDAANDQFDSEHFSGTDINTANARGAGNPDYKSYLGTPSGGQQVHSTGPGTVGPL